jgi:hypothetical protein
MSVKFEETTTRAVVGDSKHEGLVHKLGDKLTGGKSTSGYLQVCSSDPPT